MIHMQRCMSIYEKGLCYFVVLILSIAVVQCTQAQGCCVCELGRDAREYEQTGQSFLFAICSEPVHLEKSKLSLSRCIQPIPGLYFESLISGFVRFWP